MRIERGRGTCEICAHIHERYWMMDVIRVHGAGRLMCFCRDHAQEVAEDVKFEAALTGLKQALCGCCVQRGTCVEIKRVDKKVETLCVKCARALGVHLRSLALDKTIDAVEWDPTYAPPPWWQFSEKAAAERQRSRR